MIEERAKIVVVTTDSWPQLGGVSDYLHGLMGGTLAKINWVLYSTIARGDSDDAAMPYPVVRFSNLRKLGEKFGDAFFLTRKVNTLLWKQNRYSEALKLLKNIIEEHDPAVILVPRWCEAAHFWLKACRELELPYALIAHGLELVEPMSKSWMRKRENDLSAAKVIFSNSHDTKSILKGLNVNEENIVLLHPGLDLNRMDDADVDISAFDVNKGEYILTMGRLIARKGFDLTIKAFDKIADKMPGVSLLIAGDGPERSHIEACISKAKHSENIHYLGRVSHGQKLKLYRNCKYYTMANKSIEGDVEGFGIVFLEANYFRKAVIGGNNGGVPDAVLHDKTGLLVNTDVDEESLANALLRLYENPDYADRLGEEGYKRVANEFSWTALGEKFVNKIHQVLAPVS